MPFSSVFADTAGHPLIAPSVLAALLARGNPRDTAPVTPSEAEMSNRRAWLEVLQAAQTAGVLSDDSATRLVDSDCEHVRRYEQLRQIIPEVAEVTGCHQLSVERLARALLAFRLLGDYLEILTPPKITYERTPQGTVDLLAAFNLAFRRLVGGTWSSATGPHWWGNTWGRPPPRPTG